jgi:hypothetical protein
MDCGIVHNGPRQTVMRTPSLFLHRQFDWKLACTDLQVVNGLFAQNVRPQ